LFFVYKGSLRPEHLAVERLTEGADSNPNAFYDALLRDKVDDLGFQQVFEVESVGSSTGASFTIRIRKMSSG
jgi:hypothetical protein